MPDIPWLGGGGAGTIAPNPTSGSLPGTPGRGFPPEILNPPIDSGPQLGPPGNPGDPNPRNTGPGGPIDPRLIEVWNNNLGAALLNPGGQGNVPGGKGGTGQLDPLMLMMLQGGFGGLMGGGQQPQQAPPIDMSGFTQGLSELAAQQAAFQAALQGQNTQFQNQINAMSNQSMVNRRADQMSRPIPAGANLGNVLNWTGGANNSISGQQPAGGYIGSPRNSFSFSPPRG